MRVLAFDEAPLGEWSAKLRRRARLLLLLAVAGALVMSVPRPAALAQEAAPQAAEPAAAAPAAPAAHGEGAGKQTKSTLTWFLESSGWIGAVLLLLSMYFIATVGKLFFEMRAVVVMPPDILAAIDEMVERRDFKGIYALVKEDDSPFSRIVSAGLGELSNGLAEAREAMDHVSEVTSAEMEKKISMLAVLGTLGPMIGLLGTLKGMIKSFSVIALHDTQLNASEVAGGISEALLLTFEGVALSVPAIYFFAVFRNRVSILSVTTLLEADELLRRLLHATRAKPAGAPKV
jgi:biopolymer transport protein ExbB